MNITQRFVGWVFLALFIASIPFANWWLTQHGLWHTSIGPVPSAVWIVGAAFVFRDVAQLELGRSWTWVAIAFGIFLSWWVSAPQVAVASAAAFAWSETTDALVFTKMAARGTARAFLLGVCISGYAASFVDSALFVRIAFGSWAGWWQLTLFKILFVMAATPIAWGVRRAFPRYSASTVVTV